MKQQVKATKVLAAATLSGCATPTMAKIHIERLHPSPPVMRSGLRPKVLTKGNALADPARPHTLVMTVMVKGFLILLMKKKYVPYAVMKLIPVHCACCQRT
jgi:hypothetical protein